MHMYFIYIYRSLTITSTKGTPAIQQPNFSGAMLSTAPISSPPADRPFIASSAGVVSPSACK